MGGHSDPDGHGALSVISPPLGVDSLFYFSVSTLTLSDFPSLVLGTSAVPVPTPYVDVTSADPVSVIDATMTVTNVNISDISYYIDTIRVTGLEPMIKRDVILNLT